VTRSLGPVGIWARGNRLSPELAAELEALGYGAIWIGGSPAADLAGPEALLDATDELVVATGIVNIWRSPADEVARSYHRIAERQGFFKLALLIGCGELLEGLRGVVAVAVVQLGLGIADQLDLETPVLSVGLRVGGIVAERVIGTDVLLRLPDTERQIVGIEERLAAGVGGESVKSLLRIVETCPKAPLVRTGEDAGATRRGV